VLYRVGTFRELAAHTSVHQLRPHHVFGPAA